MSIKSPVFIAPTNVMALGHPFIAPAYTNIHGGIPIGIDLLTRELVYFDPWLLKNLGVINSAFGLLTGPKGHGKSASLKIIAIRLMMLAAGYQSMRTMINDYKPEGNSSEYGAFSAVCRSTVFRMADMSVNPFEPRLYGTEDGSTYALGVLGTAKVLCEFSKKTELTEHENTALRIAVGVMMQLPEYTWSVPLLFKLLRSIAEDQTDGYFRNLDTLLFKQVTQQVARVEKNREELERVGKTLFEMTKAHDNYRHLDIQLAGDTVSTYLGNILNGSYGHMFGTKDSLYSMLTQRAVTKDWRGIEPEAETLMRIIDTRIKSSAFENNRIDLLPHIEIDDEKHKSMDNLIYARSHSYFSEIARGTHICNLSATHRLDSIRKGGEGSEQYRLGETIINNLGFVFLGKQSNDKKILSELSNKYSLTNADTQLLTQLPPHTFGVKLGETEPFRVIQIFATPLEMDMLKTDAATDRMIDRPDLFDDSDLERFAKEAGVRLMPDPSQISGTAYLGGEEVYHSVDS